MNRHESLRLRVAKIIQAGSVDKLTSYAVAGLALAEVRKDQKKRKAR